MLQIQGAELATSNDVANWGDLVSTNTMTEVSSQDEHGVLVYGFDDNSLALLLAANFEKYFSVVMLFYHDLLHSVAYSVVSDPCLAQDIVQDALIKAYKNLKGASLERVSVLKLRSWLCCIVKNTALDYLDVQKALKKKELMWVESKASENDSIDAFALFVLRTDLLLAMKQLSLLQYRVIGYHYFLGLTLRETAEKLGVTLGTVKKTHSRALDKLRQCYKP